MRHIPLSIGLLLAFAMATAASAAARSSADTAIQPDGLDSGGRQATGGVYALDASLGGIAGVSAAAAPTQTVQHGYIGQLTETTHLVVTAITNAVDEGGTTPVGGVAGQDDATLTLLTGTDIVWSAATYPVGAISASGVATTLAVYADTPAVVTGRYLGVTGSGGFLVRNSNPDNYGRYANDRIADTWQVRYFGLNNPNALPGVDVDGTGRDNLYRYIADLDPTNPASIFLISRMSNLPPSKVVYFPSSSNRLYALLWTTNLSQGVWTNLLGLTPVRGTGSLFGLSDTNTTQPRFYRVDVQLP